MNKAITFDDCLNYAMLFDKGPEDIEIDHDFNSVRYIRIRLDEPVVFKGKSNTCMTLVETDTNSEIEIFYQNIVKLLGN